jgi:hypothetical protein
MEKKRGKWSFVAHGSYVYVSYDRRAIGLGWWTAGHRWRLDGWLDYSTIYYDGEWFTWRVGPLFYWRTP